LYGTTVTASSSYRSGRELIALLRCHNWLRPLDHTSLLLWVQRRPTFRGISPTREITRFVNRPPQLEPCRLFRKFTSVRFVKNIKQLPDSFRERVLAHQHLLRSIALKRVLFWNYLFSSQGCRSLSMEFGQLISVEALFNFLSFYQVDENNIIYIPVYIFNNTHC
jgi:hypothetical protein